MTDEQPSTSTYKKFQIEDDNMLIDEVKRRKLLWDRKQKHFGNRTKEWQAIATILNRKCADVKTRFRNLRDTFYKEEMKVELRSVDDGKTLLIYAGDWVYFEKLLFLYGNRNAKVYFDGNIAEFNLSEHSNESDDENFEVQIEDGHNMLPCVTMATQTVPDTYSNKNTSDLIYKTASDSCKATSDPTDKRKFTAELFQTDNETDEDVLFVKSLVPFFKKLNPLKRLIVKNDMQNLLIKEMFCGRCQLMGIQPNCHCKLNE